MNSQMAPSLFAGSCAATVSRSARNASDTTMRGVLLHVWLTVRKTRLTGLKMSNKKSCHGKTSWLFEIGPCIRAFVLRVGNNLR